MRYVNSRSTLTFPLVTFTARSIILSVCLSDCLSLRLSVCLSHACFMTKRKNILPIFWYQIKRQFTLVFSHQQRLVADVFFPFGKRRLWPISAYNVWTVRASEKCSIVANRGVRTFWNVRRLIFPLFSPSCPSYPNPQGWIHKYGLGGVKG